MIQLFKNLFRYGLSGCIVRIRYGPLAYCVKCGLARYHTGPCDRCITRSDHENLSHPRNYTLTCENYIAGEDLSEGDVLVFTNGKKVVKAKKIGGRK